jgi:nicotinamidase-related amidase
LIVWVLQQRDRPDIHRDRRPFVEELASPLPLAFPATSETQSAGFVWNSFCLNVDEVRLGDHNEDLHGNVPDNCSAALLLVDVLNDLDVPGAAPLRALVGALAKNIAALMSRCQAAGIPAIYVNDNRNKWRSDFSAVVHHCLSEGSAGKRPVEPLVPAPEDYIVLKPKHSAFYATPLETLLSHLQTKTIILVGLTTDACILTTACEIHIRDMNLFVPSDCVAAISSKEHRMALELMKKSFKAHTLVSKRLNLKKILSRGK